MRANRITARQGLIADCAAELARKFPMQPESNYRQNVWGVLLGNLQKGNSAARTTYYKQLSTRGQSMLASAIAKEARALTCRDNPQFPLNIGLPILPRLPR